MRSRIHIHPIPIFFCCVTVMLAMLSPSAMASPQVIESITRLLTSDNPQAAYASASQHREQLEGEPEFDYLYALAAIRSGHLSEGVLALERVVSLQPANVQARFELAKGYYMIGDNVRARREFDRVMTLPISESEKRHVNNYLSAIRQRELRYETTATAYVQIGGGYDTNINTAPASDLADNLLPIRLGPEATDKSDALTEMAVGGQIDYPLTRRTSIFGELNGRLRKHRDKSSYDNDLLNGQIGAKWTYKNNLIKAGLLAQQFRVDGDVTRNMAGATIEALHGFTPRTTLGIALSYMALSYPEQTLRDSNQVTLGATVVQRWLAKGEPTAYLGVFAGEESAKQQSDNARSVADRTLQGIQAGGDYKLSDKLGVRLALVGQQSDYTAPFLAIPSLPKRSDSFLSEEVSLVWLASTDWKVTASFTNSDNSSNIDMYNYSRRQFGVSIRHDF